MSPESVCDDGFKGCLPVQMACKQSKGDETVKWLEGGSQRIRAQQIFTGRGEKWELNTYTCESQISISNFWTGIQSDGAVTAFKGSLTDNIYQQFYMACIQDPNKAGRICIYLG